MSCCTFVRTQLNVRGKSQHSGRGFYVFEVENLTFAQLKERVERKLPEWEKKGIIEKKEFGMRDSYGDKGQIQFLSISFKEEKFGKYYRHFFAKDGSPWNENIIAVVSM